MAGLRLIVGLGNPGPEHARTRHNAGFRFVDTLAEKEGVRFGLESKLFGETAKIHVGGEPVWLLKPSTYMNLSGKSVTAALRYWKIAPEEALLAHDELDRPPGTARLKCDGGHGGQNGLRDTMQLLGHGKFHRLRIGIIPLGVERRVVGGGHGEARMLLAFCPFVPFHLYTFIPLLLAFYCFSNRTPHR